MSASVESIRKCAHRVCAAGFLLGLLLTANDAVAGQITLAWDPSEDTVAGYIVYYGNTSGTYTGQVDVGNQTSGTVQSLTNGRRYYFVVRAYSASGLFSAASNEVSGISQPPAFTDDPLLPGVHSMKAVHISELRSRIDALRLARGLSAWPWTSASAGTLIRATHITEMRTALDAVFQARGVSAPTYLDGPTLAAGTPIKALHITQLRLAVTSLE